MMMAAVVAAIALTLAGCSKKTTQASQETPTPDASASASESASPSPSQSSAAPSASASASASTSTAKPKTVVLRESDSGKTTSVRVGDTLVITLKDQSGSTGYQWKISKKPSVTVLKYVGARTSPPPASTPPMPGTPGTYTVTYKVVGGGTTSITMDETPAGSGRPAGKHVVFKIRST